MGTSRGSYNEPHFVGGRSGVFDSAYHYEMVSDSERVHLFHAAIRRTCPGKTVLEVGYGTGVLSIAALPDAKRVYTVELDPRVARLGDANLDASGFRDKLVRFSGEDIGELIRRDALPWKEVDVVIAELLSTALVVENQVPVMRQLAGKLRGDCVRIPGAVVNVVEGVNAQFRFDGIEVRSHFYEFSGVRRPRLMTESRMFDRVRFDRDVPEQCDAVVELPALVSGEINAVRVTSIVSVCPGVNFYATDSLMPPVIVPLSENIAVREGEMVRVRVAYRYHTSWSQVTVHPERG